MSLLFQSTRPGLQAVLQIRLFELVSSQTSTSASIGSQH